MAFPRTPEEEKAFKERERQANEAAERLFKSGMELGKTSKLAVLNPKNWPPKVRLVVVAALAAGLGAAGVPQGVVALVTQLFGG